MIGVMADNIISMFLNDLPITTVTTRVINRSYGKERIGSIVSHPDLLPFFRESLLGK